MPLLGLALGRLALSLVSRAVFVYRLVHIGATAARHRSADHVLVTWVACQLHALDRHLVGAKLVQALADLFPLLPHRPHAALSAPADARAPRKQPLPSRDDRGPKRQPTLARPLDGVQGPA